TGNRSSCPPSRRSRRRSSSLAARTKRGRSSRSSFGADNSSLLTASRSTPTWGRRTAQASSRRRPSSFEIGRKQVRDPVLDLVPMIAVLAEQRALEDLSLLDIDGQREIALADGATQDLHEVPLHRAPEGGRAS